MIILTAYINVLELNASFSLIPRTAGSWGSSTAHAVYDTFNI